MKCQHISKFVVFGVFQQDHTFLIIFGFHIRFPWWFSRHRSAPLAAAERLCEVEKAVAIHCGGWDEIDGGQCNLCWTGEAYGEPHWDIAWKTCGKKYGTKKISEIFSIWFPVVIFNGSLMMGFGDFLLGPWDSMLMRISQLGVFNGDGTQGIYQWDTANWISIGIYHISL